ncbi:MAG: hypothetical protein JF612_01660, partial [Planctomycetia bacterium]|nr:hypothetical protein [Planctomycetia bacterium]
NKTALTINAGGGNDTISLNNPTTPAGLTSITVNGGDPTADSDTLIVNGTSGVNAIGYNPSNTIGSGSVTVNAAPAVIFNTIESVVINGAGGDDNLTYTSPNAGSGLTFTPGATVNSGRVDGRAPGGGSNVAYTPMSYINVGRNGTLTFANSNGQFDTLIYNGTSGDDVFGFSQPLTPSNSISLVTPVTGGFSAIPLIATSVSSLFISSQDGDDTFNFPGPLPYSSLVLEGGDPSASDVVNLSGASGAVTVNLAAKTVTGYGGTVSLSGVETLNLDAGVNNITISGAAGPDDISVTPTGGSTATITSAGLNLTINTTNSSALTIDADGSTDAISFIGTNVAESINVVHGATTTVQRSGPVVWKTVNVVNAEALTIEAGLGDDFFSVGGSGGPELTLLGGGPNTSDVLQLSTGSDAIVGVFYGDQPDTGIITDSGSSRINFDSIEHILLLGNGPATSLSLLTTSGDDAVTQNGNSVQVSNGPDVSFFNYQTLSLQTVGGADVISIAPATANGVTTLSVNGGDPTASDTVTVNGTAAIDNVFIDQLTLDGARVAGLGPTVNLTAVENLVYSGNGGNDNLTVITPANGQVIALTPGSVPGEGAIDMRNFTAIQGNPLLPINFTGISANGTLTFADVSGMHVDDLRLYGTSESNIFRLSPAGVSTLVALAAGGENVKRIPVSTPGIANLNLIGLDGDDTFEIPGNHPFTNLLVDGGDPSASDVLSFTGSGVGAVTVNLATQTVQEAGFGAVSFAGVETLNVDAAGANATFIATAGDDSVDVTPTGADAVTVQNNNSSPTINFRNVGATFLVDGAGSSGQSLPGNTLNFFGDSDLNTFNLSRSALTLQLAGRQIVTATPSFASWNIKGGNSADTFNLNDAAGIFPVELNIDGGSGSTNTLNYNSDDSVTYVPGTTSTSGAFQLLNFQPFYHVNFTGISVANVNLVVNTIGTVEAGGGANQITATGIGATSARVTVDNGTQVNFSGL